MSIRWMGDHAAIQIMHGARAGLGKAALMVMRDAQARAPVESGALKESARVTDLGDRGVEVGFGVPHAVPVHEGTLHIAERPFLRNALNGTDLEAVIASEMRI